jgi:hypothetical protein
MIEADTKVWLAPEDANIFRKNPEKWTADDVARVVARYQEYMAHLRERGVAPKAVNPKRKKRRKAKACQLGLFAKETAT